MAKKNSTPNWGGAIAAAGQMTVEDSKAAERNQTERQQRSYIPLDQIKVRQQNTREINANHASELAESIATLGLLEPLVVDMRSRLLAGGHRLTAIQSLKTTKSADFLQVFPDSLIPVRVMPFDADKEPDKALQCEVAENEHRRDYTVKEVRALAERLMAAGYTNKRARPKQGEKAIVPALEIIVGKSRRTIMRYLSEKTEFTQGVELYVTDGTYIAEKNTLDKAWKKLKIFQKLHLNTPIEELSPKRAALCKKLPRLLDQIEEVLVEIDEGEAKPE
jgi:ParB family transcriptional regulator, chromosome partitioning protein